MIINSLTDKKSSERALITATPIVTKDMSFPQSEEEEFYIE
ncbi:MAG: hypothetical protein CM15mP102_15430 [Flavobacteriales bacterium]|nr:MAG: hypothetical protein CM15mP102_15430 [Flavobacteriales bacterium]